MTPRRLLFISYSHCPDVAEGLAERLESLGLACWFAPRDLPPGHGWEPRVARAVADAAAVIFLLDGESVASQHCEREITLAGRGNVPILVLQRAAVELPAILHYYIGGLQWMVFDQIDDQSLTTALQTLARDTIQPFGFIEEAGSLDVDEMLRSAEHARQQGVERLAGQLFDDAAAVAVRSGHDVDRALATLGQAFTDHQLGTPIDDRGRAELAAIFAGGLTSGLPAHDRMRVHARLRLLGVS